MFSPVVSRQNLKKGTYSIVLHERSVLWFAIVVIVVLSLCIGEIWLIRGCQIHSHLSSITEKTNEKSLQNGFFHPIDIVYTWVNGSDPELLKNLMKFRLGTQNSDGLPSSANDDGNHAYVQQCSFQKCIASKHMTIKCQFPRKESLNSIRSSDSALANAIEVRNLGSIKNSNSHWILISFLSEEEVLSALTSLKKSNTWSSKSCTVHHAYWTLEEEVPLSYSMPRTIMVSGLPKAVRLSHLTSSPLGEIAAPADILLYHEEGAAVITVSSTTVMDNIFKVKSFMSGNLRILGKKVKLHLAKLVLELPTKETLDGLSPSRFEDKEELRYSLRSVEKYAPWVRHIWLVTNGQIPNWLNLNNPKLTLITHEEIFLNKSHLPTFNSNAIESNLHRIPGLSEKYLCMNDDMMFGSEVSPYDFYTDEKGVKIHLSWPVPPCHYGCVASWIGDGHCNRVCNNAECYWDMGDCKEEVSKSMNSESSYQVKRSVKIEEFPMDHDNNRENRDYKLVDWCSPLCADMMLGDKHCDMDCNTLACGFDCGDCGTSHFQDMPGFDLSPDTNIFHIPSGTLSAYWNLTNFMKTGSLVTKIAYSESEAIRVVALSLKSFSLTLVLKPGFHDSTILVSLIGKRNGDPIKLDFYVVFDTIPRQTLANSNVQSNSSFKMLKSSIQGNSKSIIKTAHSVDENKLIQITFAKEEQLDPNVMMKEMVKKYLTQLGKEVPNSKQHINVKNEGANGRYKISGSEIESLATYKSRNLMSLEFFGLNYPHDSLKHSNNLDHNVYGIGQRWISRKLQDIFSDTLRHVDDLYSEQYGFLERRVPAHMGYFTDKKIMEELQSRYQEEFEVTSSNKIRSSNDMQYAFAYFYFIMSEKRNVTLSEIFDDFDLDHSGTWSKQEICRVLNQTNDSYSTDDEALQFQRTLMNCLQSQSLNEMSSKSFSEMDAEELVVSKPLVVGCQPISKALTEKYGVSYRFKHQVFGSDDVNFDKILSDIKYVDRQLNKIRKNPKKFICLNDDLDQNKPQVNDKIRILLKNFYQSLYPKPSSFELQPGYQNDFHNMSELQDWQNNRLWLQNIAYVIIGCVIMLSLVNFFLNAVVKLWRKLLRKCKRRCSRGRNKTKDITCV